MISEKEISQIVSQVTAVVATKEDFADLVGHISKLDNRVSEFNTRTSGLEISFAQFQHQQNETNTRISSVEDKLDKHLVLLDKLIGRVEDMRLEYAAVSTQLSRHEEWIKTLAQKAGLKLEY